MGEEVQIDDGVAEWEAGLPCLDDLTPLSQSLIPAELASAFSISPEPTRTAIDVNRASHSTLSSLRGGAAHTSAAASTFKPFGDHATEEAEPEEGSEAKKSRMMDSADDLAATDSCADDQSTAAAKALKRPRLVWTPQLHKRFVDVVAHLGLKNAVPKTIMQLMNVEGLTRENVASHLQKYRLYVKRMQGLSNEGPSPSDHLFASTPVPPQSFNESSIGDGNGIANASHSSVGNGNSGNNHIGMPIPMPMPMPMPYPPPMQMMGMTAHGHGFHGYEAGHSHHNHHSQQQYSSMVQQQRDWSGNKYSAYPHHLAQNHNKC